MLQEDAFSGCSSQSAHRGSRASVSRGALLRGCGPSLVLGPQGHLRGSGGGGSSSSSRSIASSTSANIAWLRPTIDVRHVAPILDARDVEACSAPPGGPPRRGLRGLPVIDIDILNVTAKDTQHTAPEKPLPKPRQPRVPRMTRLRKAKFWSNRSRPQNEALFASLPISDTVQKRPAGKCITVYTDISSLKSFSTASSRSSSTTPEKPEAKESRPGPTSQASLCSESVFIREDIMSQHQIRGSTPSGLRETLQERAILGRNITCRGVYDEALVAWDESHARLADFRSECRMVAQDKGRKQAARWREARRRKQQVCELKWRFQDKNLQNGMACSGGRVLPSPVQDRGFGAVADLADEPEFNYLRESGLKPQRPLQARLRTLRRNARARMLAKRAEDEEGQEQDEKLGKTLDGRTSELSTEASTPSASRGRVAGRRYARTQDTAIYDAEAFVFMHAFTKFDEDNSLTLDQRETLGCLEELGLRARSEAERAAVRDILWNLDKLEVDFQEFSSRVVPEVRRHFCKLRRPRMEQLFHQVDARGTGSVSMQIAADEIWRLGAFPLEEVCEEAFYAMSRKLNVPYRPGSSSKIVLKVDEFAKFVPLLQELTDRSEAQEYERIASQYSLGTDEPVGKERHKFRRDLVHFHRLFSEYNPRAGRWGSTSGVLDHQQIITVMRESGFMPKNRIRRVQLGNVIEEAMRPDKTFGFPEFLTVANVLLEMDRERYRKVFDTNSNDKKGTVAKSEIVHLLLDVGINATTPDERMLVDDLIEDCNDEGRAAVFRDEFVNLCQTITTKLYMMQQERVRQFAVSTDWTEQMFTDCRSAFQIFDEDMSEVLERDELIKAIELIGGRYSQSTRSIVQMLFAMGCERGKECKVNFLTFLRLLRALQESEEWQVRMSKGSTLTFPKDQFERMFVAFQAFEPENRNVSREHLEQLVKRMHKWLSKEHSDEVLRVLKQEPSIVGFPVFLRLLKTLEPLVEGDLEDCLEETLPGYAFEDEADGL